LLLNVDMENLTQYLNVSTEKLQSKGISSVKSRVANLTQFNPDITVTLMCEKLIEAFAEIYDCTPKQMLECDVDQAKIELLKNKFASWEWNFGRSIPFTYEVSKRFDWGDIQLLLNLNEGKVIEAVAFSDAMDPHFIVQIADVLIDCEFFWVILANRIDEIPIGDEMTRRMAKDIKELLLEQNS
ncbi:MAG: lipoate protein ligase C-terminal domain-containing protein, partial [Oscillospiraceae bacterium]